MSALERRVIPVHPVVQPPRDVEVLKGTPAGLRRTLREQTLAGRLQAVGPLVDVGGGRAEVQVTWLRPVLRPGPPRWRKPLLITAGAVACVALVGWGLWWIWMEAMEAVAEARAAWHEATAPAPGADAGGTGEAQGSSGLLGLLGMGGCLLLFMALAAGGTTTVVVKVRRGWF